ncbi:MAG TPA: autotransporter-associated beta strand repeat-containing protein [Lacipirellulaceae bacterium]
MSPFTARLRARVAVTLAAVMLLVAPARAIDFLFFYDDPDGQGFLHPTQGEIRRAALEEAGEIWGRLIPSTYEGETVEVRASFGAYPAGSTTWASASPNYFYSDFDSSNPAYQEEVNYPKALANHLALRDLAPVRHEIQMTVNQAQTFFFGIHGTPSPSEGDFISIAVHELGHGLGYDNSFQQDGDYGILGARTVTDPCLGCLPMPYDLFLTSGAGGPTLTSLSTSQRASALVSGNVFWNGATATAANGGAPVEINAPNPYNAGSSIAHLDPSVANSVMVPGIAAGAVLRTPSAIDRALLRDMGWTINVSTSQIQWTGLGADNDASTAGNWSPALPEADDRLVFDQSPQTDVDMNLPLGTIQWISFPATAPAYTLRFKSNIDMDITANGINNSSTNPQKIFLESPLEDEPTPSLFDSAATLTFKNTANAGSGNVEYYLSGGGTSIGGGPPPHIPHRFDRYAGASVTFENNSTAGSASFELEGGSGDGGPNAQVTFRHDSTASDAEFRSKGGRLGPSLPLGNVAVGFGGEVRFEDNSRAGDDALPGHATFHNEGQAESFNGAGGFTVFTDSSSAANAEIHNHGATTANGIGGATYFYGNSAAGTARITNHADGSNYGGISARTVFQDSTSAGNGTIENEGSPSQAADPGITEFRNFASAGSATINNRGHITVGDLAGRTYFYDNSTAANATLRTFDGYSDHGRIEFHDESTAADAHLFIENEPLNTASAGGYIFFYDDSTAARSEITMRAGTRGFGGVQFYTNATAADAQVVAENDSGSIIFYGNSTAGDMTTPARSRFTLGEASQILFYDQSTAADAIITLANRAIAQFSGTSAGDAEILAAGGAVYTAGSQAYVNFVGTNATAAESTIIVLGASAPLASPASIYITGGASPGNADLIAHGGTNGGTGASIVFNGAANGATARVDTTAGALVDFADQRLYNDISLGSIGGAGTFALKGTHLTVGSRPIDTVVTGPIIDHPGGFVTGGRLTKVGAGTITLAGTNTYTGATTVNGGTLRVTGSLVGSAIVNNGGRLEDSGTNIAGGVMVNAGGVYAPGSSPGTSTIGGLTMMSGGILEFEIGDPLRDRIVVTNNGNITLDGILKLSLLDGFMPTLGQSFALFEGAIGSITGAFDAIIAPTFNGLTLDVVQNAGSVLLQVGEATLLPGDFNADGSVDAADYVVWRKNAASANEYNTWRANFGRTSASGAAAGGAPPAGSSAVPEPTALAAVLIALCFAPVPAARYAGRHGGCH